MSLPEFAPSSPLEYYSAEELAELDPNNIPKHIAIIPDGNRRWARHKSSSVEEGHREGADNLMEIVKASRELGIKVLTFYIFSTENWNRPVHEVHYFMALLERYLKDKLPTMLENGVRLSWIGNENHLPGSVLKALKTCVEATAHCQKMSLVLAVNYGGRDELVRTCQSIVADVLEGKIKPSDISENLFGQYVDTSPWGDPSLLIRTSGEMRISNFLLWQLSYAEIYVTKTLWPEFRAKDLLDAVRHYHARERRLGGG